MTLSLQSPAFDPNQQIPERYSGEGEDRSPPLAWSGAPPNTKTYALIVDDPDAPAGTFVHWIVFNIPATKDRLQEGLEHRGDLTDGTLQGRNDFDRFGYGGPRPPAGESHHYHFKIYALDDRINLSPGATKIDLERAMRRHVLEHARLVGRYQGHH